MPGGRSGQRGGGGPGKRLCIACCGGRFGFSGFGLGFLALFKAVRVAGDGLK